MSKTDSKPVLIPSAEELILEEAQRMARAVQKPGQTKEQTKLIAQGIAKGIELYKKQQGAKARERDKARKRVMKSRQNEAESHPEPESPGAKGSVSRSSAGIAAALRAGGGLFAAMAAVHLWRAVAGWTLVVGSWIVPVWGSLAAAALFAALSSWFFYQAAALR